MGAGKGLVAAVKRAATPGQHLTKAPAPRVLIERFGERFGVVDRRQVVAHSEAEVLAERLRRAGVPTVQVARSLSDYNLNEWDCLIARTPPTYLQSEKGEQQTRYDEAPTLYSWKQEYPDHLSVVCVVVPGNLTILDAYPAEAEGRTTLPDVAVLRDDRIVGTLLRKVNGLRGSLDALVTSDLVPAVKVRDTHMSFRRWIETEQENLLAAHLPLTPFLLGPDDVILAGSYPRSDLASVWLLPDDIPDLYPWVVEALREWHDLYPGRFPALPDWQDNDDWRTAAETAIAEAKNEHSDQFKAKYEEYLSKQRVFEDEAKDAKLAADSYQRALISEYGPALERAVEQAIADLGFRVINMDQIHPEGDLREDLRVYDDADPDWVAIVEVKGGKSGAKDNELQKMGKWATRFGVDEGREPSAQWFVVNHLRFTDPSTRPTPFGNKAANAQTFAEVDGSIIDTRALFDLLRIVEADPNLAPAARALIRGKPPTLTRVRVEDLEPFVSTNESREP
jgi:hypothetical protein